MRTILPSRYRLSRADVEQRASEASPDGRAIVDLSGDRFFELGAIVDWAAGLRPRIRDLTQELDDTLESELQRLKSFYERHPGSLDRILPPVPFDHVRPATFVWIHLLRTLVIEGKAYYFKRNEGVDFFHAVLAGAYASIAMLDKHWKRRVNGLPKPNQVAPILYRPELDQFIRRFEDLVTEAAWSGSPGG